MEILRFAAKTGAYLEPRSVNPPLACLKMAREGLLIDLRAALNTPKRERLRPQEGVSFQSYEGTRLINLSHSHSG